MTSVLVVDDDERLYELLQNYLEQNGIGSAHAVDGRRALSLLDQGPFDAVLLDIMMPGPDGLSVLKKIREKSRVPVIMLTAKGDETDRVVGLELGADDYLTKPFSPRELLARIKAVLRRMQPGFEQERLSVGPDLPLRNVGILHGEGRAQLAERVAGRREQLPDPGSDRVDAEVHLLPGGEEDGAIIEPLEDRDRAGSREHGLVREHHVRVVWTGRTGGAPGRMSPPYHRTTHSRARQTPCKKLEIRGSRPAGPGWDSLSC